MLPLKTAGGRTTNASCRGVCLFGMVVVATANMMMSTISVTTRCAHVNADGGSFDKRIELIPCFIRHSDKRTHWPADAGNPAYEG